LLEMGDVIRTLNSVDIDYVPLSPKGEKLTAQQLSIKNIKLKVEAMLKDRDLLIQDCRKLSLLTRAQKQKLMALEAQFHVVNTVNICEGVSLRDIDIHRNLKPTLSLSASTLSDDMLSQQSSIVSKQSSGKVTDAAASEIVRQSQELAKCKKQEEEQAREIDDLQFSQKTHKDTISRLESENERLSTQLNRLKESLGKTKKLLEDAVVKRDEFKENLVDIIAHYKELQVDHEASNDKIAELESMVVKMQSVVRETRENQAKQERKEIIENTMAHDCNMEDLLVAYGKAQNQIEELQESLIKQELGVGQYKDTMTRFKKMERERNDFQRKLDRALEETRLAKQQVQKEKDESKQIRRQLKTLMQHRDDETASLESGNNSRRSASSTRSQSTRSLASKKALVKKASFKPLTVDELMKKDIA
jgi:DNA repair exonuclease SbcCD ATPase subunit